MIKIRINKRKQEHGRALLPSAGTIRCKSASARCVGMGMICLATVVASAGITRWRSMDVGYADMIDASYVLQNAEH